MHFCCSTYSQSGDGPLRLGEDEAAHGTRWPVGEIGRITSGVCSTHYVDRKNGQQVEAHHVLCCSNDKNEWLRVFALSNAMDSS